ncbi:sugar phosphate isomerase/epimerase family protein [Arthrobacter sp. 2MCAF15]|uniref:sugar phosphate isomerase/epimerase family protein n=1 Tax=Arthrobacter sp. 2MCAF15 TaxID=3232984 RepID=UPI003F9349EF
MASSPGSDPMKQAATLTPGICSVTLRSHGIDEVVAVAAGAGLSGIEWGTDVHVVDAASADHARQACDAASLKVLSLGSYYRAGTFGDFDHAVALAVRAGAPRLRIWAGTVEPDDAPPQLWDAVVADTRRIAALAAEYGLQLAFEFHGGTLTSTVEGTLELLERVDRPNVGTYWQPTEGLSERDALASLRQVIGRVAAVHCFSWWPGTERLPLEGRTRLWQAVSEVVREHGRDMDMMLEFVEGDLPDNAVRDAGFLRRIAADAS